MIAATRAAGLALAVFAAGLAGAAAAAGPMPVQTPPAASPFKLGALELVSLRDAQIVIPNDGKTFGFDAGPAEVSKVLTAAGAPADSITVGVDALLVRTGGHVVLLDTGLGFRAHGALVQSLALAGVKPEDVTDVLITHAHFDHVGGLVGPDGLSAFPKAVIRLSAKEWASVQGMEGSKALVQAIASQVKTFEPGETVAPGITAVAIAGHTPGHVGYEIVSGSDRLLDIGDMAHSSIVSLARPDWIMGFDGDTAVAKASRVETLKRLAASGELVFAPHFPFPCVGRVEAKDGGFVWRPTLSAQP